MKVGLLGNFNVDFTTENDYKWTLEQLGHRVIPLQENTSNTDQIASLDIDLLIYVHTHGWNTPGNLTLEQLFERLEARKIPTVSIHLDKWLGLEREGDVSRHPFWKTKYVFTADGGAHEWYKTKGINHFWYKPGVKATHCYLGKKKANYNRDIIFVGSRKYHKEWPYRPQLIDWLRDTYKQRFTWYGNDGLKFIPYGSGELNDLYASAKIVIGDSLCLGFNHPNYWSNRAYEAIGRGAFMIHPFIEGMQYEFKDREEIVYYKFGDFEGLRKLIEYYLINPNEREKIRLRGFERVKKNYTYHQRLAKVLDIIKSNENKRTKR